MRFPLVGMSHRFPANTVLSLIPPGTALYLVREPENPYDPNAIKVWIKNFAEVTDPESCNSVANDCVLQDKPVPDLTQPFMLGYIKAQTIDDDHLGADQLGPRIDKMVAEGEIADASEIPVVLTYGSSGRPSVEISESDTDEIETADAEGETEQDYDELDGDSGPFESADDLTDDFTESK